MVLLHELEPGVSFEDLHLQVHSVDGVDPASKPKDPVYVATMRDPSGYCRLIYRSTNSCKPNAIKKGKFYLVSGQVTSYQGRMQLQTGSSWGKIEKVNGHETSRAELARSLPGLGGGTATGPDTGSHDCCPVPTVYSNMDEMDRAAGCRSLTSVLRLQRGSFQLLALPPASHVEAAGDASDPCLHSVFGAVLLCESSQLGLVIGEDIGQWVLLEQLPGQVSASWLTTLQQLAAAIINSHAAGLVYLGPDYLSATASSPVAATAAGSGPRQPVPVEEPPKEHSVAGTSSKRGGDGDSASGHASALLVGPLLASNASSSTVLVDDPPAAQPAGGNSTVTSAGAPSEAAGGTAALSQPMDQLSVTVLSGFPGAGKTVLLQHILCNTQGLRVAVLASNVGGLSIDAALVQHLQLVQAEQDCMELQNGCMCCSPRGDLIVKVGRLAKEGRFDHLIVESAGFCEPMQLAETFTTAADAHAHLANGTEGRNAAVHLDTNSALAALGEVLGGMARLDACVTVVDASTLLDNIHSLQTIKEVQGGGAQGGCLEEAEEDDRNVCDTFLDQIEYADVILLNKTDAVDAVELPCLLALLRALNSDAKLLPTVRSAVELPEVLRTGLFSLASTKQAAGWLKEPDWSGAGSQHDHGHSHDCCHGHPTRRHPHDHHDPHDPHCHHQQHEQQQHSPHSNLCCGHDHQHGAECIVSDGGGEQQQGQQRVAERQQVGEAASKAQQDGVHLLPSTNAAAGSTAAAAAATASSSATAACLPHASLAAPASPRPSRRDPGVAALAMEGASTCRTQREALFGQLVRSKGFTWVAGRDDHCAEWSQAGNLMRFSTGGPWYAVVPREAWPTDPQQVADIERDFLPGCGDRRQEIVFIGMSMDEQAISRALDTCLATDKEVRQAQAAATRTAAAVEAAMQQGGAAASQTVLVDVVAALPLPDPFKPWPAVQEFLGAGDDDDQDESDEDSGSDTPSSHGEGQSQDEGCTSGTEGEESDATGGSRHKPQARRIRRARAAARRRARRPSGPEAGSEQGEEDGGSCCTDQADGGSSRAGHDLVAGLPAVASSALAATSGSWQPGRVLDVTNGAAELQAEFDAAGRPVATIDWYAPWADACKRQRPVFDRLAARYPGFLFARVNVEAGLANEAIAKEKVMARPGSRRESSKPVLKGGLRWPCFTGHQGSSLQPIWQFTGADAMEALQAALADMEAEDSLGAKAPPAAPPPRYTGHAAASAARSGTSAPATGASGTAARSTSRTVPLQQLKRGAADLKRHLSDSTTAGGAPLVVAWVHSGAAAAATQEALPVLREILAQLQQSSRPGEALGVGLLVADVETSAANAALAEALQVSAYPTVHIYQGMKITKALKGSSALAKLPAAISTALGVPVVAPAPPGVAATPAPPSSVPPASRSTSQLAAPATGSGSVWDPPSGKYARPGAHKVFAGRGSGVFWPRMPCLECGCPWWSGEGWDARCMRCGWDCHTRGYDDDCVPLPEHKAKYETITAILRTGVTPPWGG